MSTRRASAATGINRLIGCCAVVVGCVACGHPAGASPVSSGSSSGASDVASAVVNINGHVTGGTVAGTGMIIRSDGIVLTNNHVVAGTVDLVAQVDGTGPLYRATVLGVDPTQDVAVVRLEGAAHLPTVPIDTTGVVVAGDDVTGMGNALGHNGSPVSATGTVTALDQTLTVSGDSGRLVETLNGLIQFSAAIQPGDSGGPLLNGAGSVIGMDTAASDPAQAAANGGSVGAAIPINTAISIADQITAGVTSAYIQSGHSGTLGVEVADAAGGAQVTSVIAGDAAASAGIVEGDVVTELGGAVVQSAADVYGLMRGRSPGDPLTVVWLDPAGARHQAKVTLSPGPPA
jgi:S1-C subfamily serine protease